MNSCERFKYHLARQGRSFVENHEQLGEHMRDCSVCKDLLQSWTRIPDLLDELPEREPDESLLRGTRQAIAQSKVTPLTETLRVPRLATSLASAAVLLAAIGLSRQLFDNEYPALKAPANKEAIEKGYAQSLETLKRSGERSDSPLSADPADLYADRLETESEAGAIGAGHANLGEFSVDEIEESRSRRGQIAAGRPEEENDLLDARLNTAAGPVTIGGKIAGAMQKEQLPASEPVMEAGLEPSRKPGVPERQYINKLDADGAVRSLAENFEDRSVGDDNPGLDNSRTETTDYEESGDSIYRDENSYFHREDGREQDREDGQVKQSTDKKLKNFPVASQAGSSLELKSELSGGFSFFGYYGENEALSFQPAQGYWANTHIPGDPAIRLLKARLAQWDRSGSGQLLRLEQDVKPVSQPFDAPADNALALSLMSDANAVEGATRMRLQVGIRGIEHRRGQRPAMNLGVVIDLPADADDDTRIAARSLLDAVLASKQPGDRFSLVIDGQDGLVVTPQDFRFGPLQLAREVIAGSDQPVSSAGGDLTQSIAKASELVRQTDDPSMPLGSSSILLISADTLENVEQLRTQIHTQATEGITFSMVPLGQRIESRFVEQLVLAGLGNRRILESPDQARQLVEAELHASSRAVARAARLSIRLAPGVRLIDVIGSGRLDAERSQRVREIENSMDQRLSANLGIQADRGEDEDGIQIVIPSIFSGDDVTVLLDVMVTQPGDVASVSLRYKDLVYLRNGSLHGQLSLPAGPLDRGPAENAVTKNLLAHHFSAAAASAADALGRQHAGDAIAILVAIHDEIAALRTHVPAFANDPDLLRDQQVLKRYIEVLGSSGAYQPELADSLRYAAWAKAHRPLAEWK